MLNSKFKLKNPKKEQEIKKGGMLLSKCKKIVLLVIAIIVLLLSFVGGQAYAKYMSRVTGQGTADIASWRFKVNENEEKLQTIALKSTMNNTTLINNKIAPGTEGEFQIKIDATGSEVGINYVVKFENESQKPTNLKFLYEGNTYASLIELEKDLIGTINSNDENKVKNLIVGWNWKYETGKTEKEIAENDIIDTKDAKQINNYTFDVIVSGTQVKPQ